MQPTEIERLLLLSIKTPDDIAILKTKYGITVNNFPFLSNEAKFVYKFIEDFERTPGKDELLLEFPNLPYTEGSDNLDYVASEFNREVIRREAVVAAHAYLKPEGMMEKDSRWAISRFIKQLETIRDKYVYVDSTHRKALDAEGGLFRLERYQEILSGERVVDTYGLGIEPIDDMVKCLPGNLIGIFADTGIGKSWLALKIASEFFVKNERVVVVSPELSIEELEYRSDVILGRRLGYNLSYTTLLLGRRDIQMAQDYEKFLVELGMRSNWINYDSSDDDITVESLEGIIVSEKPKLLIIDGIYLMSDDGYSTWERVKNICNGLKILATKYKVVIIMINQAQRDAADTGRAARKGEAADGYYFTRASDILISLGQIRDTDIIRELKVLKLRSAQDISSQSFQITFDADKGNVGEQPDEPYAPPDDVLDYR